ncbi:hypothetical protein AB6A23_04695 [Paenibacillus tarimensis]
MERLRQGGELLERMREPGRRTAAVMYGCSGFTAHHNTDIWAPRGRYRGTHVSAEGLDPGLHGQQRRLAAIYYV